ncbi:4'-phosphopantetheinyl transferase family protein [Paeniglutamicibacter sp. R2-26]|uniref:4'-phosphopantetheinyl transferase family protein n=1 Tax=Paeniglutamicibacter sp. R2-26 TaxID=3144417 RepID=UPI003EE6D4A7
MGHREDKAGPAPADWPRWAAAPLAEAARHPEVRLSDGEVERAGGYRAGRPREDFTAGRVLARVLAAGLLGRTGESPVHPGELVLAQHCPACASSLHGVPRIVVPRSGLSFAVSYARTAGWMLLGLAPATWRIGVDLVDLGDPVFAPEPVDGAFDAYAYAPGEVAQLAALPGPERRIRRARWWALKEAVAKAAGEGIAGSGGIPVVDGPARHLLLRSPGTGCAELGPGMADRLGHMLPEHLVGSIVWAPR